MRQIPAWLLAVVPLLILPGFTFYFDVIPRLSLLLLVAAGLLLRRAARDRVCDFWNTGLGRAFTVAAGAYIVSLLISTVVSANPSLSIYGGTWRRYGLITHIALLVVTIVLAADLMKRRDAVRHLLRAFATLGLLAAIYGTAQYFGRDPFLNPSGYHIGEGVWAIVRPPGTAGHADYFAIYLLMVSFTAGALMVWDRNGIWRALAAVTMFIAAAATVLTGTRGAVVGGLAGLIVVAARLRPRLTRNDGIAALALAFAALAFYFLPTGERLRARVRWSAEDLHGGARLWLWRDSLRMAAQRPLTGFGPETYSVEFPHFQSIDLARAYPGFRHESPHNIGLDVLVAQGFPGAVAFAALLVIAVVAAWRTGREYRKVSSILLGCLAAIVAGQQFCSPTLVTALCTSVTVACLMALAPSESARTPVRLSGIVWFTGAAVLVAIFLAYAVRLSVADRLLEQSQAAIAASDIAAAAAYYGRAETWLPPGASADLVYSRSMAAAAAKAPDPALALHAWQEAMTAGQRAIVTTDEPANAAYNVASLYAAANDLARTEEALRMAIRKAPTWFKPHWMLARVLALSGRLDEAELAASAALTRNGNANPEVLQTLNEIKQKKSHAK
jgi:O-antigen ligase